MRTFKSFKDFVQTVNESKVDLNKLHIAKQSLVISDLGSRVEGAMSKADAVATLRDAGIQDAEIRKLLMVGGALPTEIELLMKK